jgi:hypothetical protein
MSPKAGVFFFALAFALAPRPAGGLHVTIDGDQDDSADQIEAALGSDPADPASTPEHFAAPPTCLDGADNDGDGATDLADTGCDVPAPSETTFPPAGDDAFESTMNLDMYAFDAGPQNGICPISLAARGPTVARRSDPTAGVIMTEIIAMQLAGTATVGPDPACNLPPGDYDVTIVEDPSMASAGMVTSMGPLSRGPRGPSDFPADSFFDVFFLVDTGLPGIPPLPGGPPGGPAGAVRVANVIATLPPYHGGKNPLCYTVPGLPHEHCPQAPADHFLCYTAKFEPKFEKRTVTLRDQFDLSPLPHEVKKPKLFCNAAAKNAEPISDSTRHLKCYQLKGQKLEATALVQNQFGMKTIETKKSDLLCLASDKNDEGEPVELDDYKCYKAKFPKLERRPVTLLDQFQVPIQTEVVKSERFCNPVSKDQQPIKDPLDHLECFKIKPVKVERVVTVENQFGTETVTTKKAVSLCVPSSKNAGGDGDGEPEIRIGIRHGKQMSFVCFLMVNGPPNEKVAFGLTPDGQPPTIPVTLDANGVGGGEFTIFSTGPKTLFASGSFGQLMVKFDVGPSEVPCPTL